MIAWIKNKFHKHKWEPTLWNDYFHDVEQKCRCGEYRHFMLKDLKGFEIEWQKGEHPNKKLAHFKKFK